MLEELINCWKVCTNKHLQALQPRNSTLYYIFYLYTNRYTYRYKCCDTNTYIDTEYGLSWWVFNLCLKIMHILLFGGRVLYKCQFGWWWYAHLLCPYCFPAYSIRQAIELSKYYGEVFCLLLQFCQLLLCVFWSSVIWCIIV